MTPNNLALLEHFACASEPLSLRDLSSRFAVETRYVIPALTLGLLDRGLLLETSFDVFEITDLGRVELAELQKPEPVAAVDRQKALF